GPSEPWSPPAPSPRPGSDPGGSAQRPRSAPREPGQERQSSNTGLRNHASPRNPWSHKVGRPARDSPRLAWLIRATWLIRCTIACRLTCLLGPGSAFCPFPAFGCVFSDVVAGCLVLVL